MQKRIMIDHANFMAYLYLSYLASHNKLFTSLLRCWLLKGELVRLFVFSFNSYNRQKCLPGTLNLIGKTSTRIYKEP